MAPPHSLAVADEDLEKPIFRLLYADPEVAPICRSLTGIRPIARR
jgi:hypothetical protein